MLFIKSAFCDDMKGTATVKLVTNVGSFLLLHLLFVPP